MYTPAFDIINMARMLKPITHAVPSTDFRVDFQEGLKKAGAIVLSKAVHTVNEYKMQTEVLIAIICPNLANGWIVVCVSGTAAIIVVRAELITDTPI